MASSEPSRISYVCSQCGNEVILGDVDELHLTRDGRSTLIFHRMDTVRSPAAPFFAIFTACGPVFPTSVGQSKLQPDQVLADVSRAIHNAFPDRADEMVAMVEKWKTRAVACPTPWRCK